MKKRLLSLRSVNSSSGTPGSAEPPPPATSAPARAETGTPAAASRTLAYLEHRVEVAGAAAPPERLAEWKRYLWFLRDYTDYDGALPAEFESLVEDVFGDLLEGGPRRVAGGQH